MGYAENLGSYWRGRYKVSPGKYATVRDADGEAIRFRTKASAKRAADAEEAKLLAGTKKMAAAQITFGTYASRWYAALDLAASTMQNYRRHIEEHLLPAFENFALADIQQTQIAAWEKQERAVPYAASSVKTWRATLPRQWQKESSPSPWLRSTFIPFEKQSRRARPKPTSSSASSETSPRTP